MQTQHNTGVLFITHDFGVVADIADGVIVMQHGLVVESGSVAQVLNAPQHPYTRSLIAAIPKLQPRPPRDRSDKTVLVTKNVMKTFGGTSWFGFGKAERQVRAVNDVSVDLYRGETLGIVGESGSGKSTLARCIIRLVDTDSGTIAIDGIDIARMKRNEMRPYRHRLQMVFQDPYASLNPRIKVGHIIAQGPITQGDRAGGSPCAGAPSC